jgi:hypothetical protein
MERSPWEAKSHSDIQEIPPILCNPNVHYHVQKNLSRVYPEPQAFSPHLPPIFLRSILILSSHLRLGLQSRLIPSGFQTKVSYAFTISPMRATCPIRLALLDSVTLMTFVEAYKLRRCPSSGYFLPVRPEYSPQHPVLKDPQSMILS